MKFLEKHPIIMIFVGVIGISLSAIFVRYSSAPSTVTAAFRLLWTIFLMTPTMLIKTSSRTALFSLPRKPLFLSILSGIFLAVHFILWFESLQHTSVASSTTIVCTEVIWVSIGYCIFLKGKISKKEVAAILLTLLGSTLIAFADSSDGSHLQGDILSLLSAVAVAIYVLIGRFVRKSTINSVYTYVVYLSCSACLLTVCLIKQYNLFIADISAVLVGLLLAVFSTILGHSIFSWCLKFFSPAFVSASKLCEPVVASLFAILLFGEIPSWLQLVGAILILFGVFYYSSLEMKKKETCD